MITTQDACTTIQLGDKVMLKACRFGEPGKVIRKEHRRFAVYWADMDHWSRHPEGALEVVSKGSLAIESER